MPTIEFVVPSYNGVWRCNRLLDSVAFYDPQAFDYKWTIYEDPCRVPGVDTGYDFLTRKYAVQVEHIPTWSNMHGAARYALERSSCDWVVYLGDDVLVTPYALSDLIRLLRCDPRTVGLVQIAYWNAHDLSAGGYDGKGAREHGGVELFKTKDDMYSLPIESWIHRVPRNSHWDGEGYPRPYVNVNGVGFAIHRETYESVGGFAEGTWCLDESISVRTWLDSPRGVVCCPGAPVVHYFGGAAVTNPPAHDLYTNEAFEKSMGMTKEEAGVRCYAAMAERSEAILKEMRGLTVDSTAVR